MLSRRSILTLAMTALVAPATSRALAQGAMSRISAYAFSFPALSGEDIRLAAFTGRPFMVVNTASNCGYTPQFVGLQELWSEFRERGFTVIGVPSNDFGSQEPGGATEIAATARHEYGTTFPLAQKLLWQVQRLIRFSDGQLKLGPRTFLAGTSINTSSAATAISQRCLRPQWNRQIRGSRRRSAGRWRMSEHASAGHNYLPVLVTGCIGG
jgi:hypothetical protein